MGLSLTQAPFIGTVFEGWFYGIYCVILSLYIRLRLQKRTAETSSPLLFPLLALFVLCTVFFALDFTQQYLTIFPRSRSFSMAWSLNVTTSMIYTFVDLIAQGILIYRCWVMWNRQPVFVVIPSILALTSFATGFYSAAELAKLQVTLQNPDPEFFPILPKWFTPLAIASFSISLGVNAFVTGLLILRLYNIHREFTKTWMVAVGRGEIDLLPAISMLIESGMFTFIAQALYVIFFSLESNVFLCVSTPIAMVYGITPTLLIVRVSMRNVDYRRTTKFQSDIHFTADNNRSSTINVSENSSNAHS